MKRNIYQFGKMIQCETKRWPTDYLGYGCWCGLGGKGTPVDETDQCCKEHDLCYKKAHRTDCFIGQAYTVVYNRKGCSGCDEKKNKKYEQTVCECDSVAVKCFKKAKFNDKYKRYSQTKCH
ncbi:Basic phospholipase A2 S11-61 [Exaiptasia diaphana]|nr:Basic phospholipase A2 S11-61 [Exaiptasia diaphana]